MSVEATADLELTQPAPPIAALNARHPKPAPSNSRSAIRRCCAAWKRAYNATMDQSAGGPYDTVYAEVAANKAYCAAMPTLEGSDGVRDFIACMAHGIQIGAIPAVKCKGLLAAARVAVGAMSRVSKTPKSGSSSN